MTGSGVLPVAIHKNKLYFLFGKENALEDSAKGFADFGGSMDKNETPFEAAMREGAEETTGFLGDAKELEKYIKSHGGVKIFKLENYFTHVFALDYDQNLPKYYNMNHRFLWNKMDKKVLNDSKLFEKIEIQWFRPEEMMSRISEFRGFYQEMIKILYNSRHEIKGFIQKNSNKTRRKSRTSRKINVQSI